MTYAKLKKYSGLPYTSNPNIIYLRDGEVVVYRRSTSTLYQCSYKLADGKWQRQSTRKASVENAVSVACLLYDEARFRQKLGLAHKAQTFAQIAHETLIELRAQIDLKRGRGALDSYVTCIERYFLPYFADKRMEELAHKDIMEFEELFRERIKQKLFRISDGYQPPCLNGAFRRLMRDCSLLKSNEGQTRTLYSLRHTYATLELIENRTDIHTLARQMGNSALIIERHYSKLTATLAAERLV